MVISFVGLAKVFLNNNHDGLSAKYNYVYTLYARVHQTIRCITVLEIIAGARVYNEIVLSLNLRERVFIARNLVLRVTDVLIMDRSKEAIIENSYCEENHVFFGRG